jgi:hypothetical protein
MSSGVIHASIRVGTALLPKEPAASSIPVMASGHDCRLRVGAGLKDRLRRSLGAVHPEEDVEDCRFDAFQMYVLRFVLEEVLGDAAAGDVHGHGLAGRFDRAESDGADVGVCVDELATDDRILKHEARLTTLRYA